MNLGKLVFAQVTQHLPLQRFGGAWPGTPESASLLKPLSIPVSGVSRQKLATRLERFDTHRLPTPSPITG